MNILFLTRLYAPHIGGVETHVYQLSKALVKRGHVVTILTENHGWKSNEKKNGIMIRRITVGGEDWFKKLRIWVALWQHRQDFIHADIIHCHDVFFWYFPFRFIYPFKKVYTTFHGYESYPIKNKAIVVRKISEKLSFGTICIGDFMKKWYNAKPTFISYGGVHTNKTKNGKNIHESAVFIGRLDDQTGIQTYIRAVEKIVYTHPTFTLAVIGNGKYMRESTKHIAYMGWQDKPDRYIQKYHFAFVSRYLSILEAFVARKLVFAVYDNPVKKDYLQLAPFSKWIILVKDEGELAERVNYFLSHKDKENVLVEKAFIWVSTQTWDNVCTLYLRLWNKDT